MPKKEEKAPEGAPEWMLTYGDMVTLLLCFFVLLFTMSEIKKDKLSKTMRAFQKQFGVLPKYKATVQVFVQAQRMTETESNVLRRGPPGKHTAVQTIVEDEKMKVIVGGKSLFEADSAVLLPEGRQLLLTQVAPDLRGFKNRIEVRGHTASTGRVDRDLWYLGYERAFAVMRFLADPNYGGIDPRRFRVVSCSDNEPRATNLTDVGREENRRVEIIMTEEFIKEIDSVDQKKQ
jgi:chemotaxis protein MotB